MNNKAVLLRFLTELDWDSARHLSDGFGVNGCLRPLEAERLSLSFRSQKTFDLSCGGLSIDVRLNEIALIFSRGNGES